MTTDSTLPKAGFGRRAMALVYDFFLLLGIALPYGVLVTLIRKALGQDPLQPASATAEVFILIGLWFCCSLFYSWCWRHKGQTLGMKSWRIRLYGLEPSNLTYRQCFKRCALATLLNGCGGIGMWWCYIDKNGDALYDKFTNTCVELLPKK